jgi:hypothetical protein
MDVRTVVTVTFREKRTVIYRASTLQEAAAELLAINFNAGQQPLVLELKASGTKLRYDEAALVWYLNKDRSFDETIEALACDGLYSNQRDISLLPGQKVEQGSLWARRDDELTLVSDDEYAACSFTRYGHLFYCIA